MSRGLFGIALLLASLPGIACGLDGAQRHALDDGGWLDLRFQGPAPKPGVFFALELQICRDGAPLSPGRLRVDADMPAHGHGMNYRARVRERGAGRYTVDGLLFHMPGDWRVRIDVTLGERMQTVELEYRL